MELQEKNKLKIQTIFFGLLLIVWPFAFGFTAFLFDSGKSSLAFFIALPIWLYPVLYLISLYSWVLYKQGKYRKAVILSFLPLLPLITTVGILALVTFGSTIQSTLNQRQWMALSKQQKDFMCDENTFLKFDKEIINTFGFASGETKTQHYKELRYYEKRVIEDGGEARVVGRVHYNGQTGRFVEVSYQYSRRIDLTKCLNTEGKSVYEVY